MTLLFARVRADLSKIDVNWECRTPAERATQLAMVTANLIGGFIRIHPFLNGNGRTSRLLCRYCLLRFGVPPKFTTHPRPALPYGQLMAAAMRADYRPLALEILAQLNGRLVQRPGSN